MSIFGDWPEFIPDVVLVVGITNGNLTLGSTSKVNNHDKFDFTLSQLRGGLWRNGTRVTGLDVDSSSGAITLGDSVSVSENDLLEFRVLFVGRLSTRTDTGGRYEWAVKTMATRTCSMAVPFGDSTTTFDANNYAMPVPSWALAFGWDNSDKFKVGFKVSGDDGASQNMLVTTRLVPSGSSSSSPVDLSSTSTQTHTSSFTKGDVDGAFELEFSLRNATGFPRVNDQAVLFFAEPDEVDDYPTGFPTSDTCLQQTKSGQAPKLDVP